VKGGKKKTEYNHFSEKGDVNFIWEGDSPLSIYGGLVMFEGKYRLRRRGTRSGSGVTPFNKGRGGSWKKALEKRKRRLFQSIKYQKCFKRKRTK